MEIQMTTFILISDPNMSVGGDAEFRIHRDGCCDIEKHTRHPRFRHAGSVRKVQAETAEDVVKNELARLNDEFEGQWDETQFKVLPCCHGR